MNTIERELKSETLRVLEGIVNSWASQRGTTACVQEISMFIC
jgi:hypothetical protein